MEKRFVSGSEKETINFAANLAKNFKGGEAVLLYGDLGAGKTRFAKGLAKGLEISDTVISPTFTIMNVYGGRLTLYHFDMYRIQSESELYEIGYFEAIGDKSAVTVIEWPQNIAGALPKGAIEVNIKAIAENAREITVTT
jgi:tRNA threonylcarbamoyladenosine biosynthesis protein TsaE